MRSLQYIASTYNDMDSERLKKTISAAQEEFTRLLEQRGFAELKAYEIHLGHIVEGSARLPPPDRSLMPKLLYGDSLPEILGDHVGEPAELLEALADEAEEIYREVAGVRLLVLQRMLWWMSLGQEIPGWEDLSAAEQNSLLQDVQARVKYPDYALKAGWILARNPELLNFTEFGEVVEEHRQKLRLTDIQAGNTGDTLRRTLRNNLPKWAVFEGFREVVLSWLEQERGITSAMLVQVEPTDRLNIELRKLMSGKRR